MRIFPLDGGKLGVIRGEHLRRYVARPTACVMNVEGVEEVNQPPFLKRRQAKRGGKKFDALAAKTAHEAQRDVKPKFDTQNGTPAACAGRAA